MAAESAAATDPLPSDFAWLSGPWTWQGEPAVFSIEPYGIGIGGEPYLVFHGASGLWVLALAGPGAFGILIGSGMRGKRARFTGDVTVDGAPVRLRQTWRLGPDNAVEIENERQMNREWELWDRSLLKPVRLKADSRGNCSA
jgi:hypothetical protein